MRLSPFISAENNRTFSQVISVTGVVNRLDSLRSDCLSLFLAHPNPSQVAQNTVPLDSHNPGRKPLFKRDLHHC